MQVVILAGGLGTRLGRLTETLPKPMVPVAGRPFLDWQLGYLARQGLRRVLLLTGYLGERIEEHLGDGAQFGLELQYSREDTPLGTGGGLLLARDRLEERFLLLYGDSFLPEDYGAIGDRLRRGPGRGLMVVSEAGAARNVRPNVALDENGRVLCYDKSSSSPELRFVEAGVVGLRADVLAGLPAGRALALEQEVYPRLAADGELDGWLTRERFYDMGTPAGLRDATAYFERERPSKGESGT